MKRHMVKAIHPFPARMAPEIVLERLPLALEVGQRVLDPMMGSGTTVVSARAKGYESYGLDRDPLAVLIASAWAHDLDAERFVADAHELLVSARRVARRLSPSSCFPVNSDDETRAFVSRWFDPIARRQLAALDGVMRSTRFATNMFLRCAMSRMIITKQRGVSLAWDVSHSRPHRKYNQSPVTPFDFLLPNVDAICDRARFKSASHLVAPKLRRGDCRHLPYPDAFFDYVLTSPPYLNAIDYLRGHRLSLVWMGHTVGQLRTLRATNVGAEIGLSADKWDDVVERMVPNVSALPGHVKNMIRRYACDLDQTIGEIKRVSRVNASICFIVGDCTVRGVDIRNSEGLNLLAERNGLTLQTRESRPIEAKRRYLPPPGLQERTQLSRRMWEEIVLEYVVT